MTKGIFVSPETKRFSAEALSNWVRTSNGSLIVGFKPPDAIHTAVTGWLSPVTNDLVFQGHALIEQLGGEIVRAYRHLPMAEVRMPSSAIPALNSHPLVNFVEPNGRGRPLSQDTAWGAVKIESVDGWASGYKGGNTHVTIIDGGLDYDHYTSGDVDPNRVTDCAYATEHFSECWDAYGHGSHVFGIIAAEDNGIGYIGVAPRTLLAVVRACDDSACFAGDVAGALDWAIDQQWTRHVVNLSLGFPPGTDSMSYFPGGLQYYVELAYDEGLLLVAAGGKSSYSGVAYPAAWEDVIAVSGTLENDAFASSYNCEPDGDKPYTTGSISGSEIELSAPFHAYSLWNAGGYELACGTSMSAPYVSAVAAATWGVHTTWSRNQIRNRLQSTAVDLGSTGRDSEYGYGRVDIMRAVEGNPISVSISGPDEVPDDESCTWSAFVDGGTSPYSYTWSGVLSGSSYLVSGVVSQAGELIVDVSDYFGATATDTLYVDVDEFLEECHN